MHGVGVWNEREDLRQRGDLVDEFNVALLGTSSTAVQQSHSFLYFARILSARCGRGLNIKSCSEISSPGAVPRESFEQPAGVFVKACSRVTSAFLSVVAYKLTIRQRQHWSLSSAVYLSNRNGE